MLIVMKFGGSSLASASHIRRAAELILRQKKESGVVVVVSAQGSMTDELLRQAAEQTSRPAPREKDVLLSCGEQMSMSLMSMQLEELGAPAVSLCGWQAGIRTDGRHGDAHIRRIEHERILRELRAGKIVVVAGFQGVDDAGDITTIGRGGSDTTAVALTAALRADLCRIFTDVDGVYSADPRIISTAVPYHAVSYEEMQEMADLGAKVLHARSVALAKKHGVLVEVCSSFSGTGEKTLICADPGPRPPIRGVVCTETAGEALISLVGESACLPETRTLLQKTLEEAGIPLYSLQAGGIHLTAALPREEKERAAQILHEALFPGNTDAKDGNAESRPSEGEDTREEQL
ncbi:MAG: aspartate kinase [Clostridia bacterium]|nr:aspartate kinase [Clostridia bacterium]